MLQLLFVLLQNLVLLRSDLVAVLFCQVMVGRTLLRNLFSIALKRAQEFLQAVLALLRLLGGCWLQPPLRTKPGISRSLVKVSNARLILKLLEVLLEDREVGVTLDVVIQLFINLKLLRQTFCEAFKGGLLRKDRNGRAHRFLSIVCIGTFGRRDFLRSEGCVILILLVEVELLDYYVELLHVVVEVCFGVKAFSQDCEEVVNARGFKFALDAADSHGFLVDHFHDLPLLAVL